MPPLDMSAAWADTKQLLRSNAGLWVPLAGVFILLPNLAISLLGPEMAEPAAGATDIAAAFAPLVDYFTALAPYLVLVAIVGVVGQLAIYALWLDRRGISVGEAISRAAGLLLPAVVVTLITMAVIYGGMLLLIVPGLYLLGRLLLILPLMVDRGVSNPLTALQQGWALTSGNGWRVFLMVVLVMIVFAIIAVLTGGLFGLLGLDIMTKVVEALFGAIGTAIQVALSAAIYRQLAGANVADTFG